MLEVPESIQDWFGLRSTHVVSVTCKFHTIYVYFILGVVNLACPKLQIYFPYTIGVVNVSFLASSSHGAVRVVARWGGRLNAVEWSRPYVPSQSPFPPEITLGGVRSLSLWV